MGSHGRRVRLALGAVGLLATATWTVVPSAPATAAVAPLLVASWGDGGEVEFPVDPMVIDVGGQTGQWAFGTIDGYAAAWRAATGDRVLVVPVESAGHAVYSQYVDKVWVGGSVGTGNQERPMVTRFQETQSGALAPWPLFGDDGVAVLDLPGPGRVTFLDATTARGQVTVGGSPMSFEVSMTGFGLGDPVLLDDGGAAGAPAPPVDPLPSAPSSACGCDQVRVAPDGSVLVVTAGFALTRVRRLLDDGTYDPEYGVGGRATFSNAAVVGTAYAQTSSGLLFVGRGVAVRVTPSGTLDPSFAGDGRLELPEQEPSAALVLPGGDFVVVHGLTLRHFSAAGAALSTSVTRWPPNPSLSPTLERAWLSGPHTVRVAVTDHYAGRLYYDLPVDGPAVLDSAHQVLWRDLGYGSADRVGTSLVDQYPGDRGAVGVARVVRNGQEFLGVSLMTHDPCCRDQRAQRPIPASDQMDAYGIWARGRHVYVSAVDAAHGDRGVVFRLTSNLALDPSFGDGGRLDLPYRIVDGQELPDGDIVFVAPPLDGVHARLLRLRFPTPAPIPISTGAYVPLRSPRLVLDSAGRSSVTSRVAGPGRFAVPAGTLAALLQVDVQAPAGDGRIRIRTAATGPLGLTAVDVTRRSGSWSTMVVVPLGADGNLTVTRTTSARVKVRVLGSFQPATSAASGRVEAVAPTPLIDRLGSNSARTLTNLVTVPHGAGKAMALVQVSAAGPRAGGTLRFRGGGRVLTLSVPRRQTASFLAFVPLDATGQFRVTTTAGVTVRLELTGLMTGAAAPATAAGLFTLVPPSPSPVSFDRLEPAGGPFQATVSDHALVPHGVAVLLSYSVHVGKERTEMGDQTMLWTDTRLNDVSPFPLPKMQAVISGQQPGTTRTAQALQYTVAGDLHLTFPTPGTVEGTAIGWFLPDISAVDFVPGP